MSVNRADVFTIGGMNNHNTAVSAPISITTSYVCKEDDATVSLS